MPTIDIDGRDSTWEEAIRNMWERITPLEKDGYHPVSSVEVVDTKTNEIVDTFQLTDPERGYVKLERAGQRPKKEERRPPMPHEFRSKAPIKLEQ